MKPSLKNIIRNTLPAIAIMAIGVLGAAFVYNTYFSDRVATSLAGFEPAAGATAETAPSIPEDVYLYDILDDTQDFEEAPQTESERLEESFTGSFPATSE